MLIGISSSKLEMMPSEIAKFAAIRVAINSDLGEKRSVWVSCDVSSHQSFGFLDGLNTQAV